MKLTATKSNLANALAVAARVATTSSALQAAQGALLDATGTGALVSATDFDTSITLPVVTESIESHGRVLLCQNNTPAVLAFNGVGLECRADTHDIGSAAELIEDIRHDGAPLTIGINPDFLTQALAQYGGDIVEMRLVNPLRPILLTDSTGKLSQILMPIRLNTPNGA